jgi:hypothetical protein
MMMITTLLMSNMNHNMTLRDQLIVHCLCASDYSCTLQRWRGTAMMDLGVMASDKSKVKLSCYTMQVSRGRGAINLLIFDLNFTPRNGLPVPFEYEAG